MSEKHIKTVESIVKRKVERLRRRYDADNDVIPDAPAVTHTDMELTVAVEELLWAVRKQQEEIEELRATLRRNLPA